MGKAGRNTKYNKKIQQMADEYIAQTFPVGDEEVPSIEGLAIRIDVARSTIYDWIKDEKKKAFYYTVSKIAERQGLLLINNGLNNKFSSSITKLMLSANHGMREKSDVTSDGEQIKGNTIMFVDFKEDETES